MENSQLKYLFLAEFTDGTSLAQHPEDKSLLDPEKRNTYYDLLQSNKIVKKFWLTGKTCKIGVDLSTGLFEINGLPVLLESEKLPCLPEKFELIYYKQVTVDQNISYDLTTGKAISSKESNRFVEYFLGWKCNINGKSYQQKIAIA